MNISCLCVGSLPLVLTNDVSPPGNHSVRIVASTGPEATALFFIDSNAVSTGECMIIIVIVHACDHQMESILESSLLLTLLV